MDKITIFKYDDTPVEIEVPDIEKIDFIRVQTIHGDETGIIYMKDGPAISFDADRNDRGRADDIPSIYDNGYTVTHEAVKEWLNIDKLDKMEKSLDRFGHACITQRILDREKEMQERANSRHGLHNIFHKTKAD